MSAAATPTAITNFGSTAKLNLGQKNMEIQEMPLISGDVSATVTAKSLSRVDYALVLGCTQTAFPTYSGAVATLAFTDPVATIKAWVILFGV